MKKQEKRRQNCVFCNKEIIQKYNYFRKYCSKECEYNFNVKKRAEKNKKRYSEKIKPTKKFFQPIQIKCKNCAEIFISKTPTKIFCSKECRKEYYKNEYNKFMIGEYSEYFKNSKFYPFLKLRFEIFKRDNFQCQYCGRTPRKDKCKLVIDHIIPISKKGVTKSFNLITSCEACNYGKKDILLEEKQLNTIIIENETK